MEDNQSPAKIWELLKSPVTIVSHKNIDVDGVACMIAFARELKKRGVESQLIAPVDVSRAGETLAKNLGYPIKIDAKPEGKSTLILDVLAPHQLEPYKLENFPKPVVVIDHHYYNQEWQVADLYYYFDRPSCSEIILDFFTPDKISAQVLLSGIITDTGMFKHADKKTLKKIIQLLDIGADINSSLELMKTSDDISEKIAILKAASKMDFTRKDDLLIVSTRAGSFESSVASSLIRLGADVAIVVAEKKNKSRISARTKSKKIHLGKIMQELGEQLGGNGGGHAKAAILESSIGAVELLNKVKQELLRRL